MNGSGRTAVAAIAIGVVASLILLAPEAAHGETGEEPPPEGLLDRLVGSWILEGTIGGEPVTHDVEATRVLEGHYVQLHEVARERDAAGRPAYEAIVYLDWEPDPGRYACLWLDSTGGGGLNGQGIGHARPRGPEIPLLFEAPDGSRFHTTFAYDAAEGSWRWVMDAEREGRLVPFARVTLTRKP